MAFPMLMVSFGPLSGMFLWFQVVSPRDVLVVRQPFPLPQGQSRYLYLLQSAPPVSAPHPSPRRSLHHPATRAVGHAKWEGSPSMWLAWTCVAFVQTRILTCNNKKTLEILGFKAVISLFVHEIQPMQHVGGDLGLTPINSPYSKKSLWHYLALSDPYIQAVWCRRVSMKEYPII